MAVTELDDKMNQFLNKSDYHTTEWTQLLMLRGLLAYDLLFHALTLRHCVEYGLDPRRKKKVAVPFRAVDLPSQRAEYGHLFVTHY